jgi:hypothetical protein
MEAQTATCADGCAGTAPDESWDVSDEAGSCVVEGDARLVVSHTAFVLLQCVCMHPGYATQPVVAVGQSQSSASGRRLAQLASVPVWCPGLQRCVLFPGLSFLAGTEGHNPPVLHLVQHSVPTYKRLLLADTRAA